MTKHPIQPLEVDPSGILRFKRNAIVEDLLEHSRSHGFGLNEIVRRRYSTEDMSQLVQLIGYSLSGYGRLSFADDAVVKAAEQMRYGMSEKDARIAALEAELKLIKDNLRTVYAHAFNVSLNDLK